MASLMQNASSMEWTEWLPGVTLEVRQGGTRSATYALDGVDFLIGSVPGCDLRVAAESAGVLCLFARHPEGVTLRKLTPTYSILVNGQSTFAPRSATAIASRSAPSKSGCAHPCPTGATCGRCRQRPRGTCEPRSGISRQGPRLRAGQRGVRAAEAADAGSLRAGQSRGWSRSISRRWVPLNRAKRRSNSSDCRRRSSIHAWASSRSSCTSASSNWRNAPVNSNTSAGRC